LPVNLSVIFSKCLTASDSDNGVDGGLCLGGVDGGLCFGGVDSGLGLGSCSIPNNCCACLLIASSLSTLSMLSRMLLSFFLPNASIAGHGLIGVVVFDLLDTCRDDTSSGKIAYVPSLVVLVFFKVSSNDSSCVGTFSYPPLPLKRLYSFFTPSLKYSNVDG
jgi:hypothetical protein